MKKARPDDWLSRIVPADISAALDLLGIDHKVQGDEAQALCPFHRERSPSWSINLDTGLHHCFSCHASGNFHTLVRHVRKVDSAGATSWVLSQAPKLRRQAVPERIKPATVDDTTLIMNEAKLALFDRPPRWAQRARGLDARACDEFGIRWNAKDQTWITPVRDPKTNALWGWQEKSERGRFFRNYPRDIRKSRTLFGLHCFEGDTARVVESPLDACRLRTVGLRGALASYGAGISNRQLVLVANVAGALRLCLDDDLAGHLVTDRIVSGWRVLPVSVFNYPEGAGKDPGDMTDDDILWADAHAIPSHRW